MEQFNITDLIVKVAVYVGILGFLMVIFSFLSGLRIFKPKPKYKLHKRIGIIGFIALSIHALTMLYFYFFT